MAVSTDGPVTEVVPAALDARTRVQAMTRGVDFTWVAEQLLQQRDDLLDRWQQAAAAQPFHAGRLEGAVANHIPALVDALIVVLRRVAPSAPSMSGPLHDALVLAAAEDHARVRMAQGLTAADIVTEFRLLRQEIGRALRFNVADTAPTSDVLGAEMLLHDALDDAAFLAVFAMDAKEAELRRLQDALTAVSRDVTERERAENHLLRLNERLRALLDTGQALAGTLEPDALLDGLLERVVGLLPNADFGMLYLHDPESGDLVARAHIGLDPAAFAQLRLRPGESTSGIVFQSGRPLRVGAGPDADTDMAAIELTRSEATRRLIAPGSIAARVVSSLTVPLRTTGGIVIGTLSAASTTTDFSEDDLPLMEGVASQAAMALENARLYSEARRSALDLAEALAATKHAQDQIVQQERLRALGEMASGIAHDFNNALAPVVGFSELLLLHPEDLKNEVKVLGYLRLIHTGACDAASVVARLREFYRHREADEPHVAVDVAALVVEAVALTQPRWKDQAQADGRTVEVRVEGEPVPPVAGDAAQLREVLTNLIFNAVDSMPRGGFVTIQIRPDGDHVRLCVTDTGVGMIESVRRRALEPFFSTKGERGTGLGLSVVHGIIQRHRGTVEIESAVGSGTTVTLRLPHHDGRVRSAGTSPDAARPSRRLRVLVVDDEPAVRQTIGAYLEADGHTVTIASSGADGLAAFRAGSFDIVLTDRAMPGMSGLDLAAAIKVLAPQMPIVLVTGFGVLMDPTDAAAIGVDAILSKPLTAETLRACLAACASPS